MNEAMIKITDLRKSYGNLDVLKGIDLTIAEREVVVIIGPSGSGKSTLLRCINYLEEPTGGSIVILEIFSAIKIIAIAVAINKPKLICFYNKEIASIG